MPLGHGGKEIAISPKVILKDKRPSGKQQPQGFGHIPGAKDKITFLKPFSPHIQTAQHFPELFLRNAGKKLRIPYHLQKWIHFHVLLLKIQRKF